MISCQKCGHENKLGTMFCHSCGVRLVVDYADIEQSVIGTRKAQLDDSVFRWGRSAFGLCSFALICALVLRYVMVPPMPPLEFPAAPAPDLFPKEPSSWAGRAMASATAAASAPIALAAGSRLAWRHDQAAAVFSGLGIDRARIASWQKTLLADQQADGGFPGGDPLAATALAAAALQAAPLDEAVIVGAAAARAWLLKHADGITQKPSLARTLFALALVDADQLSDAQRGALSIYLVDGAAPLWQAYLLTAYPAALRPAQFPAVASALKPSASNPVWWSDYFALLGGAPAKSDPAVFAAAAAPATGEERMAWAFTAWHHPVMPKDLSAALRAWTAAAPAPVSADLAKACGPHAAEAVGLLAACAPLRQPPLAFQR